MRAGKLHVLLAIMLALALGGCGSGARHSAFPHYKIGSPYQINGQWYYPQQVTTYEAQGVASWYGEPFHGQLTANGEIYDMWRMTAAHPTLPLPSVVRVTNLYNGRSLLVRVNDRGPFVKDRLIDLSKGAARALGFELQGLAHVHVAYLGPARLEDAITRVAHRPPPTTIRLASSR